MTEETTGTDATGQPNPPEPTVEVKTEEKVEAVADMDAVLDAVKELTKVTADLNKRLTTFMTAGKF